MTYHPADKGIGLVLSGGGGKGAYQIGVWKALREVGIDKRITAVSGTSVGGLNAALFAEGDCQKAERLWRSISPDQFLSPDIGTEQSLLIGKTADSLQMVSSLAATVGIVNIVSVLPAFIGKIEDMYRTLMRSYGFFSRDGLKQILEQDVDLQAVSDSPVKCFISCVQLPGISMKYGEFNLRACVKSFNMQYKQPRHIENYLLATSAIPAGVYKPVRIRGFYYIDGGTLDVIEHLIDLPKPKGYPPELGPLVLPLGPHKSGSGPLDPFGLQREKSDDKVPVKPLYEHNYRKIIAVHCEQDRCIERNRYPGCEFLEIRPSRNLGGVFDGVMDFTAEGAARRMELGYRDAMAALKAAPGTAILQSSERR